MRGLRRLGGVAVFAALLWAGWRFAASNSAAVDVDYLFGSIGAVALWQALGIAVGLGAGVTALLLGFALMRARLETRRFRKELRSLEAEVHQLRNLPLVGDDAVASGGGGTRSI